MGLDVSVGRNIYIADLFNARVRAQDSVPARETVLHEQNATSTSRPPTRSPAPSTS